MKYSFIIIIHLIFKFVMRNHQPGSVGNDDDRICLTILTQLHLIVVVRQQIFLFDLIYVCFSDDRKRWCLWLI